MFLSQRSGSSARSRSGQAFSVCSLGLLFFTFLCAAPSALLVPSLGAKEKLSKKEIQKRYVELTKKFDGERTLIPQERSATIDSIAELPIPQAVAFLQKSLEAPKENAIVKEVIIRALAKNGSKEAVLVILSTGFESLEPRRYSVIGDSLRRVADADAVSWIVKTGWKKIPQLDPAGQREFLRVLDGTADPRAVRGAAKLLGHSSLPAASQVGLVEILRYHRSKSSASKIARLMKIDNPDLGVTVLYALRDLEATEQSKVFLDALENRHWQIRSAAIDVLRGTRDTSLSSYFVTALEDRNEQVQIAAIHALQEFGGDEVMDPLIAALGKAKSGRVKDDLAETLVRLTGEDFGVDALGWGAWWETKRGEVTIARLSAGEYNRVKKEGDNRKTGLYYGLRVISKHVAFVIDVSGSMEEPYLVSEVEEEEKEEGEKGSTGVSKKKKKKGKNQKKSKKTKIQVAREELIKVLGGIQDGTHFNIVKFSGMYGPWRPALTGMSETVRTEAISYVKNLSPGGETNIFDTLRFAMSLEDVNTIYFLSDGAPTAGAVVEPEKILAEIATLNRVKKVKIYTIGFHLDPKAAKLMQDLAEQNYGRFVER